MLHGVRVSYLNGLILVAGLPLRKGAARELDLVTQRLRILRQRVALPFRVFGSYFRSNDATPDKEALLRLRGYTSAGFANCEIPKRCVTFSLPIVRVKRASHHGRFALSE